MKIIKAASLDWSAAATCIHCGSELELELSDLTRDVWSDPREGSFDSCTYVCPVCGRGNSVPGYSKIPAHIRDKIKGAK